MPCIVSRCMCFVWPFPEPQGTHYSGYALSNPIVKMGSSNRARFTQEQRVGIRINGARCGQPARIPAGIQQNFQTLQNSSSKKTHGHSPPTPIIMTSPACITHAVRGQSHTGVRVGHNQMMAWRGTKWRRQQALPPREDRRLQG
jgi:hypothetical protein